MKKLVRIVLANRAGFVRQDCAGYGVPDRKERAEPIFYTTLSELLPFQYSAKCTGV